MAVRHIAAGAVSVWSLTFLGACGVAPQLPPAVAEERAAPEYVIGPGDVLGIFVYQEPDLSTELPVRPDGRLSMPLVSDIDAAGRTPSQLSRSIEQQLKEYVRNPLVTVMVRNFVGPASRQIRVIGEAAQPVAMPYREGMTLLDVMIVAGGLTRYAAGNRAEIIRRDPGGPSRQVIRVRLSDLLRDGDISQDMPVRPGDTLVIPQGWF